MKQFAFQQMTVSLMEDLLLKVDNPETFPQHVTQQLVELTGAKTAIMVECQQLQGSEGHRILAVVPDRKSDRVKNSSIHNLLSLLHQSEGIQIWDPDKDGPHCDPLEKLGMGLSMAVPLNAGQWRAGGLILFNLPEVERIGHAFDVINALSQVIALSLRSCLLFEAQQDALKARSKSLEVYRRSLQAFFDNRIVGMVELDRHGNHVHVNQRWTEMTGYSQDELLKMSFRDLALTEDLRDNNWFATLSRDPETKTLKTQRRYRRKDGSIFWTEISGTALYNNLGQFIGLVALINDITDHVEEEQKRLEVEEQLRQQYKMEAVGLLAGGVAHNFNNNLSIILGNADLLLLKDQSPDSVSMLNNIKTAVRRSRDLVSQIMTFSRKTGIQHKAVNVGRIVEETLKLLNATLPSSVSMKYQNEESDSDLMISGDETKIQEALLNLCGNAVDAMDEKGSLLISVTTCPGAEAESLRGIESSAENYVLIRVRDTGCGIPKEHLDKIFDPFFTTKEIGKGTGMGLSSVHGIVQQLDGHIHVDSEVGTGTTFELYFPSQSNTDNTIEPDNPFLEFPRGEESIMLVDDDAMIAALGEKMLSKTGYSVTTMTDSVEALKLFCSTPEKYDLVITDQTMPQLTGQELALKMKQKRADIKTILCTGFSSKIDEIKAKDTGFDAFLLKPLSLPALLQTVRNVLDAETTETSV